VEFLYGLCFFFSSIGSMIIYFGLRSCMLLSGADLNGKFEIVWDKNGASDKTNHHMSTRNSKNSGNFRMSRNEIQVPITADECYKQISQLKKVLVTILAHEAHSFNYTFSSIRVKQASVDGARKSVDTIALVEIHTQGREVDASQQQEEEEHRQHQYRNQHQHQHQHHGKNFTESSKILPIASDE
jgi:hypothetical protein